MEPKEIIPTYSTGQDSNERFETKGEIKKLFDQLPPEIREECLQYFSKLSPTTVNKIEEALKQAKPSRIGALFDQWNREDRNLDRVYTREDLTKFDQAEIELKLGENWYLIFYRYLRDRIMRCDSFEEVQKMLGGFIDRIWLQRNNTEVSGLEKERIEEIERNYSEFQQKLHALDREEAQIRQQIGNRKHVPNHLQAELRRIHKAKDPLLENKFDMDYNYMDIDGTRSIALKHENRFKSAVYLSEHFGAEEYAVLLLERVEVQINHLSKFWPEANPELLDYVSRFFEEWARTHAGEEALIAKKKSDQNKTDLLVQRFVAGLGSYVKHKDNDALTDQQKETLAVELPIILRMLQRG